MALAYFMKSLIDDLKTKISSSDTKISLINSEIKAINENILNIKIESEKTNKYLDIEKFKNDSNINQVLKKQDELNSNFKQVDDVMSKIIKLINHFKIKIENHDKNIESIELKITDDLSILREKKRK